MHGHLDGVTGNCINGWATDADRPGVPVWLEVLIGEGVIACVQADRQRDDVAAAGFGDGRCGFELLLPGGWRNLGRELRVRRAADGGELIGSPLLLPPHKPNLLVAAQETLAAAVGQLTETAMETALLATLQEQRSRCGSAGRNARRSRRPRRQRRACSPGLHPAAARRAGRW